MSGFASFAAPISQGTVNSQAGKFYTYNGYVRTTSTTATTVATIPLATSGTTASMNVLVCGRDVSSGTIGNSVTFAQTVQFKNVSGTVSAANGAQGTAQKAYDSTMSTCTLTYTISGTNILIQVAGLSAVTIDWTAQASVIVV